MTLTKLEREGLAIFPLTPRLHKLLLVIYRAMSGGKRLTEEEHQELFTWIQALTEVIEAQRLKALEEV